MTMDVVSTPRRNATEGLVVALSGALSLAIAMGIGRFAFTPLLPMMLHDGVIDLHGGSVLATANYIGYLAGALLCMALPGVFRRVGQPMPDNAQLVRFGLAMTAVLTLAMAADWATGWMIWRFLAGVISALAFVYTSGWCMARLAALNQGHLGGVMFTGPGLGIALSGFAAFAMTASGAAWFVGWTVFGLSALALTAVIWPIFRPQPRPIALHNAGHAAASKPARWSVEEMLLTFAYGLAGFGYIITATFLPVIARAALPGSVWVDLFWPLFGIAVAVGALLTRIVPAWIDRRSLLAVSYVLQGAGILSSLFMPDVTGFVAGSILLGLPFTTITLFALQEVRRLRPAEPTVFMGLMTAAYGLGQIVGPLMVSAILARSASESHGFDLSLEIAAMSLLAGALIFLALKLRFAITDM